MLSGQLGNLGLMHFALQYRKFDGDDIIDWVETELAPMLNRFPEPQSIVVLDNMPEHRHFEARIRAAVYARGAILLWNPPNSADLNSIEHLWSVCVDHANNRLMALQASPNPRAFHIGDLIGVLRDARETVAAYNNIFLQPY